MTDPSDPGSRPARTAGSLTRDSLPDDPVVLFEQWLEEAGGHSRMEYPNACILSTADADGRPDGRVVLLKGVGGDGFRFFTNYRSAKGRALQARPHAALTFYWDALGRQVRVRGRVERLDPDGSDAYFRSRPIESRLGAWASEQSRPLESREALERRIDEARARFADAEVPRPPHWGGFLLRPDEMEFWSAGEARLHDRFVFRKGPAGDHWSTVRLYP